VLKFFLVGWVCVGGVSDQQCVRMGSSITHDTYESCNQYYQSVREQFAYDKNVTLKFTCVQAGVLEDILKTY